MALRLRLLSAIVAGLLLGCSSGSSSSPSHRVGSDYPVPQGPASINGVDAGSFPALKLTVPALPHCDGGESYVPADGGGMRCGVVSSGGGAPIVDGGFSVFLDGSSRGVILPLPVALGGTGSTPACSTGQILIADSYTAFQCRTPNGDVTAFDDLANATVGTIGGGEIAVGSSTGTLTAAAGATAPGLAQASESTTQTPTLMLFVPQVSTHSGNQDGSSATFLLSPKASSGVDGLWSVDYGSLGTHYLSVGNVSGYSTVWLNKASPTGLTNAALAEGGGILYVSDTSQVIVGIGTNTTMGFTASQAYMPNGFNLSVGGASINGGGTNTIGLANGTPSSGPCTGGTCVGSSSAGGLAAFGAGDGTFANVTTLQGAWTSPSTTYSALAFGRGPSCGFTTTGSTPNGCSFTIPVRATFGSTITLSAVLSSKCVGASSGCQVGSGSTPPDVWTSSLTGVHLLFAPDGTPGTYSTNGTPTSVVSYATTQAGDSCALSTSASTLTMTCTPVVVTGTPILWWEVRILDLEVN